MGTIFYSVVAGLIVAAIVGVWRFVLGRRRRRSSPRPLQFVRLPDSFVTDKLQTGETRLAGSWTATSVTGQPTCVPRVSLRVGKTTYEGAPTAFVNEPDQSHVHGKQVTVGNGARASVELQANFDVPDAGPGPFTGTVTFVDGFGNEYREKKVEFPAQPSGGSCMSRAPT